MSKETFKYKLRLSKLIKRGMWMNKLKVSIPFFAIISLLLSSVMVVAETETLTGTFVVQNVAPTLEVSNFTGTTGDLVNITMTVSDLNGDTITLNYTSPLNSSGLWQSTSGDGGVYTSNITASDGTEQVSAIVTITLTPYCGDGTCDSGTESCATCSADCGTCPATSTTSGGGGGGSSSTTEADKLYITELEGQIIQLEDLAKKAESYEANIKDLYLEMQEDEFLRRTITINNNDVDSILVSPKVTGDVEESIVINTPFANIPARGQGTIEILVLANQPPGKYKGIITLISSQTYVTIPVTLKIIKRLAKPELETLDIDVDILNQDVKPGETLKFKLNLRKAPLVTEEAENVNLKYLIMGLNTKYMGFITGAAVEEIENLSRTKLDVIYQEDDLSIENALTVPKEIELPANMPVGDYVLNINANFKGKQIPLFAKFRINVPWYEEELYKIKKGVLAMFTAFMFLLWMSYFITRVSFKDQRRYIIKLDNKSLPKNEPRSAFIGKIADENKKAYFPIDELKTHTLIAGTTGCGKTIVAQNITEEVLMNDTPVIVFDPTAQWTGFLKKCSSRRMMSKYAAFGMNPKSTKNFEGKIYQITKPNQHLPIDKLMQGKLSIILLNKLNSKGLNTFIANAVRDIFQSSPKEHSKLRTLLVFDEVHRLLPKFGGSRKAYTAIEKAVREFRKWGIGVVLISQVTQDLVGPIEANVTTQVQMKTNDRDDLTRVEQKYGKDILRYVVRSPQGFGLLTNSSYNKGQPYFVSFRPTLHNEKGLSRSELNNYIEYSHYIDHLKCRLSKLKKKAASELSIELELAEKQIYLGKFDVAKIYIESLIQKLEKRLKTSKSTKHKKKNNKDKKNKSNKIKNKKKR